MTAPDVASAVIAAVHGGDLGTLRQLVEEQPGLASSGLGAAPGAARRSTSSPTGPASSRTAPSRPSCSSDAGADVDCPRRRRRARRDAACTGRQAATTPPWPRSSSTPGRTSTCPTARSARRSPTPSATAAGTWPDLLVARGATVDGLWEAAALGLLDRLEELLADESVATSGEHLPGLLARLRRGPATRRPSGCSTWVPDLGWVPEYTAWDAARRRPLAAARSAPT